MVIEKFGWIDKKKREDNNNSNTKQLKKKNSPSPTILPQ